MEEEYFNYYIRTFTFGSEDINDEDMGPSGYDMIELYLAAINRNIDIKSKTTQKIYEELLEQLPTLEWQKEQILWFSKKLTEEEKDLVRKYANYSYSTMNMELRYGKKEMPPINKIIDQSVPLTTDIIVYRIVKNPDKFMPDHGEFISMGYFSTSFNVLLAIEASCKPRSNWVIIKVFVPKGTKCIYIPGHEYEILFSHGIKLFIMSKQMRKFICSISKTKDCEIKDVLMYDTKLVKLIS